MRELVVVSGKGGTGKTSLVASLAVLARYVVLADCDVDAADLHLLLHPEVRSSKPFFAGHEAVVRQSDCTACGLCADACRAEAMVTDGAMFAVDPLLCEGCGLCVRLCPDAAIDFPERHCGEWYVSDTRVGPLVHARLEPGAESSGKLVTLVRREARRLAAADGHGLILVDGPPGIGCPVIASLSGASELLAVTEPSVSGLHDLGRLLELAHHFGVPARVCVNKCDLDLELTGKIGELARSRGAPVVGHIPYDLDFTTAQVAGKTVIETGSPAASRVVELWDELQRAGDNGASTA